MANNIELVPVDDDDSIHIVHVQPKPEESNAFHVVTSTAPIPTITPPDDSDVESANSRQGHELRKGLEERHMSMIALSANIGFGLTINSGVIMRLVGPFWAVFTYSISALLCWGLVGPFSEMNTVMNITGPLWQIPTTFFSQSLGIAASYMYLFSWGTIYPNECGVVGHIITWDYSKYWSEIQELEKTANYSVIWPNATDFGNNREPYQFAKWGSVGSGGGEDQVIWKLGFTFLALVSTLGINSLRIRIYGELEYYFGWLKIIGLSICIIAMAALWGDGKDSELPPNYFFSSHPAENMWQNGTSYFMGTKGRNYQHTKPGTADLIAIWTAIRYTFFGFLGPEIISITAAEANHRVRAIKPATRKTLTRIFVLYIGTIISVGINTNRYHPNLLAFASGHPPSSSASPIMIAIVEAAVRKNSATFRGFAHFLNILFAFAAWSCACSSLYVGSRTLHGLAVEGRVPTTYLRKALRKTNKNGVPWNAVFACWLFGLIGLMSAHKGQARVFLDALCAIGSVCWLIVMAILSLCFLRFLKVIEHLGKGDERFDRDYIDRTSNSRRPRLYPYRTKFQPIRSWAAFGASVIYIILGGFTAFLWTAVPGAGMEVFRSFASNYIALLVCVVLYLGHKVRNGKLMSWSVPSVGLLLNATNGWETLDREEEVRLRAERTWWMRVAYWFV